MPDNIGQTAQAAQVTAPTTSQPPPDRELVRRLQLVVTNTAGVASLVPSMKTALDRLRRSRGPSSTPSQAGPDNGDNNDGAIGRTDQGGSDTSGDGITLTLNRDTVGAVLDITVSASASVLATALAVHTAAAQVLEHGYRGPHSVTVNVLGLDRETPTTKADQTPADETPADQTPAETKKAGDNVTDAFAE